MIPKSLKEGVSGDELLEPGAPLTWQCGPGLCTDSRQR